MNKVANSQEQSFWQVRSLLLVVLSIAGLTVTIFSLYPVVQAAGDFNTTGNGSFGSLQAGSSSSSTITLQNTSTYLTHTVSYSLSGAGYSAGAGTNCNGALLNPGGSCQVVVVFTPPSVQANYPGTLTFSDPVSPTNNASVALSGSGYGNDKLTPTSLNLGVFAVGSGAASKNLTFLNQSPSYEAIFDSGPVAQPQGTFAADVSGCQAVQPYGGQCTVPVSFTPGSTPGDATASYGLDSSAGGTANPKIAPRATFAITMRASVINPAAVSPASLNFSATVGSPPGPGSTGSVVVTNNDPNFPMTVSAPAPAGGRYTVSGCTGTVPPGGSCTLTLTFIPTAAGTFVDALNIATTINSTAGPYNQNFSVKLNGQATAPISPSVSPTVTPTTAPATTAAPSSGGNFIGGLVTVDDQPASGFKIILSGGDSRQATTGSDGHYGFDNLSDGTYGVEVSFDPTKYAAVSQAKVIQTLRNGELERQVNFRLRSLGTTTAAPATTPPATTPAGGSGPGGPVLTPTIQVLPVSAGPNAKLQIIGRHWSPKASDGSPNVVTVVLDNQALTGLVVHEGALSGFSLNQPLTVLGQYTVNPDTTFSGQATLPPGISPQDAFVIGKDRAGGQAQTPFTVEPGPACTNIPSGSNLRVGTKLVQRSAKDYYLCIQLVAGRNPVDLRDTVVVDLPSGAVVNQFQAGTGTVTVNGSQIRWGGFTLNARQSTTLLLDVTNNTSLASTTITISGRFSNGVPFARNISGLPPLTEIVEPEVPSGQGGGSDVVPQAAPVTGQGQKTATSDSPGPALPILLGLVALWLLTLGGLLQQRRRHSK